MDCVVCGSREGASLDRPSNSSSNRSANNSIGRHIYFVGNIPSLTSKAIRSGRNILNICFVYFVLTIAVAIYLAAASVGVAHDVPPSFQFVAIWAVFCNSFVNSFLYLFLFRYVRSKAKYMFKNACTCWEFS